MQQTPYSSAANGLRALAMAVTLAGALGSAPALAIGWPGVDATVSSVLAVSGTRHLSAGTPTGGVAATTQGAVPPAASETIVSVQDPTPAQPADPALTHPPQEVAGIPIASQATAQGHTLQLNGAGLRKRFVFDVYVAALYTERRTGNAGALIQSDTPRRLQLTLLRDIDSKTLSDALKEGLADNTSPQDLASLQPSIDTFLDVMSKAGQGRKGDVIDLDINATGVAISFRGTALGAIQDPRFGPALLRVWLGSKPAQESLKKALLGQS